MAYTYRQIRVWQKAHGFALDIYKATSGFPRSELYGLTSQLRRACVSVATNIVEGYKRSTQKDFAHFLNIAVGSLEETKYLLLLSHDLGYLETGDHERLTGVAEDVGSMLHGFQRKLTT